MLNIQTQLLALFKLQTKLHQILDDENYELFQQQQVFFSDQVNALLYNNPEPILVGVIDDLKRLEDAIATLQSRSKKVHQQLKDKSLLQKRNKSKIQAYK
ncbi:hypothetical protein PCNPT3_10295 [Psychromonas sp. CNPT3]|uniref:hypothetical protein n=1 Tax=Psychromonas sp. CNPT3 TaxID=314282 RepID=UPI00006E441B|nr:hypothetical protein [Psychromonas sp. CNPT3]AGH81997.1 hypothetical protein PCNPT3_10295 [Psychromonas sp. CNPT3]